MDTVAPHNLGNQFYREKDIGKPKTDCLSEILLEINPELKIEKKGCVGVGDKLDGYIFLCIDNIDTRRELCTKWKRNPDIIFVCDGRMSLTSGTIYAANWNDLDAINNLIASMQYTHEEALKETPVSACGMTLSVVCAPRTIASLMVTNFIRFLNLHEYKRMISIDVYHDFIEAFEG